MACIGASWRPHWSLVVSRSRSSTSTDWSNLVEAASRAVGISGIKLTGIADRIIARQVGHQLSLSTFRAGDNDFSHDQVRTPRFWRALMAADALTIRFTRVSYNTAHGIDLSMDELRAELGDDLDPDVWVKHDRTKLDTTIRQAEAEIAFLRHATMAELAERLDVRVEFDEGRVVSFADLIESTLDSHLARTLVRNGFIERHFSLYVSQFYGLRVNANVMDFILHNVETGTTDMEFTFSGPEDIDDLLREVVARSSANPAR